MEGINVLKCGWGGGCIRGKKKFDGTLDNTKYSASRGDDLEKHL